jgi:hypothetical protein
MSSQFVMNDYPQLAHRRGRFILRGTLCHYRKSTGLSSLRDAPDVLTISHRTALRLYGVINIKPLRGFFTANADNHFILSHGTPVYPPLLLTKKNR